MESTESLCPTAKDTTDKTYFHYLDALRALAFFAVFYAHMGTIFTGTTITDAFPLSILKRFTVYGSYGVNFFFVLSGFLITFLLLREKHKQGTISIRNFYIKRILRIWPVYFITLFFGVFVLPFIIPSETYSIFTMTNPHSSMSVFSYYLLFIGNFYQGLGFGFGSLAIGILWSVCIEEQFYLVWPWVVKHLNVRRLAICIVSIIALTLTYKYIYANDRLANYYLPWSVGMDLAFGSLLGLLYFTKNMRRAVIVAISSAVGSFLIIGATVAIVYTQTLGLSQTEQINIIKASLVDILRLVKTLILDGIFMMVILYFVHRVTQMNSDARHPLLQVLHLTKRKVMDALIYLGKISYGLYAYHTICLMITVHVLCGFGLLDTKIITRTMFFGTALCGIAFTVFVAHLSSNYIELKVAKYRERLLR